MSVGLLVRRWLSKLSFAFDFRRPKNKLRNLLLHFIIELQISNQHFFRILPQSDLHPVCSSTEIYGYRKPVYDGVSMNNISTLHQTGVEANRNLLGNSFQLVATPSAWYSTFSQWDLGSKCHDTDILIFQTISSAV